jgi:hypothetical protein|nr:MAG TPA: hypothetical protein [Caudoviricetes sp.]
MKKGLFLMTKGQLLNSGFKHISTQNSDAKTELWEKFTGWEDAIQYYYYFPDEDKTSPIVMTTSFMQIEMFSQMRDSLRGDFLKQDIKYDSTQIWTK